MPALHCSIFLQVSNRKQIQAQQWLEQNLIKNFALLICGLKNVEPSTNLRIINKMLRWAPFLGKACCHFMTYSTWVTVPVRFFFFYQNSWCLWKREIFDKVSFLLIASPQQIKGLGGEKNIWKLPRLSNSSLPFCYSDQLIVQSRTRLVINSWKLKKELVNFLCHLLKCQGMPFKDTTQ